MAPCFDLCFQTTTEEKMTGLWEKHDFSVSQGQIFSLVFLFDYGSPIKAEYPLLLGLNVPCKIMMAQNINAICFFANKR